MKRTSIILWFVALMLLTDAYILCRKYIADVSNDGATPVVKKNVYVLTFAK